jgi:hypothetical protein
MLYVYLLLFLVLFVLLSSSLFYVLCFCVVFYFYSCDFIILCLDVAIRKVRSTFLAVA